MRQNHKEDRVSGKMMASLLHNLLSATNYHDKSYVIFSSTQLLFDWVSFTKSWKKFGVFKVVNIFGVETMYEGNFISFLNDVLIT